MSSPLAFPPSDDGTPRARRQPLFNPATPAGATPASVRFRADDGELHALWINC